MWGWSYGLVVKDAGNPPSPQFQGVRYIIGTPYLHGEQTRAGKMPTRIKINKILKDSYL